MNNISSPQKSNTAAVVVTYHPDADFPSRLEHILSEVDAVLIVDNGSSESELSMIKTVISQGVYLISNGENLGVASALNQGLKWAEEHGYSWLLTMDQDTVLDTGSMQTYSAVYESCSGKRNIAMIGANYIDRLTRLPLVPPNESSIWSDIVSLITSGTLMNIAAASEIGMFREDFFVDYLDTEFCLRARQKGFDIVVSNQPLMEHTIGFPRWHYFLGRKLITPHLVPERRYYMSRNFIVLAKEYRRLEPQMIKQLAITRIKETILILMFERYKFSKIVLTLRGLCDALAGRMGKL